MTDYSKTCIYKICCKDLNITDIYIGHTTNFTRRKWEHKSVTTNEKAKYYHNKLYKIIRDNNGFENWDMIEIEKFPCNDANEARTRERYWIETLKPSLNCDIPNRTKKEYQEDMKEVLAEKKKEYREKNKEIIREKKKKYHEENKEIISEKHKKWYHENRDKVLERVKEYSKENKEIIAERSKAYREKNKEQISAKRSEKLQCPHCNTFISNQNMRRHIKTQHNL